MQRQLQQSTIKSISSMNGLQRMSVIMSKHDEQIHSSNKGAHESTFGVSPSSLKRNDSSTVMSSSCYQSDFMFDSSMMQKDDADMQSSNDDVHYTRGEGLGLSSTNNHTTSSMMQRPSLFHQVSLLGSSTSNLNSSRNTDQMLNNANANATLTCASQNISSNSSFSSDMSNTSRDLSDARRLSQLLKESHMLGVTRKTRSAGQNLMFMKHKDGPPMNHHNGANTTNSLRSIRFRSFTKNSNADMSMQVNSSFNFGSSTQQQPKRNMFLDMLNQPTSAPETSSKKQPVNPYFSPPQGQTQQPISSVSEMSLSGMNLKSSSQQSRPTILRKQGSFRQRHSSGNMKRTATFALRRNIRVHDAMESTNTDRNGGMALDRHLVKRRRL